MIVLRELPPGKTALARWNSCADREVGFGNWSVAISVLAMKLRSAR
jgi:hypothetical protein